MRLLRATLVGALLLTGCDVVLGIEPLPRGPDPIDAGPDTRPDLQRACTACEQDGCADSRASCVADPACASLLRCLGACIPGEVRCRDACVQNNLAAARGPTFAKFDRCRRDVCASDCYGASGFGAALDPACTCMDAACSAEMLACVRSGVADGKDIGACEHRLACIARQPNPDGYVDCVEDNAGGGAANALLDCMRSKACRDPAGNECRIGSGLLGCRASFLFGRSRAPTERFSFGVENFEGKAVIGALVKACSPARCAADCAVLASARTNDEGRVELDLPMSNGGFDGCIRVEPESEYMAINVMTGRRIHRRESVLNTLALQAWLFEAYAETPLLADRGHIVVTVHDCIWGRVSGAALNKLGDGSTRLGYIDGTTVLLDAKATTASGAAAYVNVPPGRHEIVVSRGGEVIARQTITVHAGELTDANIYPLSQ